MCEVALGNAQGMSVGQNVVDIPNDNFQSVQGVGHYCPQYQYIDGIFAPSHGLTVSTAPSGLQYNEFIVYNPDQVKIKYLFKLKFHHK